MIIAHLKDLWHSYRIWRGSLVVCPKHGEVDFDGIAIYAPDMDYFRSVYPYGVECGDCRREAYRAADERWEREQAERERFKRTLLVSEMVGAVIRHPDFKKAVRSAIAEVPR